jgi:nifR3 family TIM-barrel protein
MGEAVRRVRDSVDHIDLNFGCPDTRVMGQCAGASVPARPELFRAVIRAAVTAAGPIPVTVKFRLGLDAGTPTFRHAGRIAEEEGCAAVALHARTVEDAYRGEARWECIRELKDLVSIPVLGNGDVFRAADGLRMLRTTGCDAVLVGRGCLGNPWLFSDLRAVLGGEPEPPPPGILEMGRVIRTHYRYLRERFHPRIATRKIRKCGAWYACGFPDAAALREGFQGLEEPEDLERLLERMEANLPGAPREGSASR